MERTEEKAPAVSGDLARLAAAYGVATEHHGWRGDAVHADEETVRGVLGALGVDTAGPDAVRDALAAHETARRRRLLPPVIVTRTGRGEAFSVHTEPGAHVELWIELEDGGVRRDIREGDRHLPPAVDGVVVQERTCVLPVDLPLGWYTLHARVLPTEEVPRGSGGEP
ncbi:MAG: 4-alpha-glucanotransferase, partial [Streptomycetaceae bacterium]|nr:4-alpha-glucanotransferase [Streptomycetaceae bacterium]